jgi:Fuc2NAc and GlcNAc transferase
MMVAALLLAVFVGATLGTSVIRRIAIARNLMDVPNARSSHVTPTPRGGGVAIVVAFLAGVLAIWLLHLLDRRVAIALGGSGLLVAMVGFIDDRQGLPPSSRLAVHVMSAAWALYWLDGLPPLVFVGHTVNLGGAGHALALITLVWLLNLYNFMDGIDGIAGVECVTVCAGGIAIALQQQRTDGPLLLPAILGAAALGFLVWNFPPARIFMGDAGSGFLGLMLGVLAVDAAHRTPQSVWSWLILLSVFTTDATVTLLRRLLRGAKPHEAHRTHAYQHASRWHRGHRSVTLVVAMINIGWLLPLALAVQALRIDGLVALLLAGAPLVWMAFHYDAGVPEPVT